MESQVEVCNYYNIIKLIIIKWLQLLDSTYRGGSGNLKVVRP